MKGTVKTRKAFTTLYEKQEKLEEAIKNVSLENIDEILDLYCECRDLEFDLRDAIYCRSEELQDQISKREIFTIEEIQNIEKIKQRLSDALQDVEIFSGRLRELEDEIIKKIPKVKESFKLRTSRYIVEIQNKKIVTLSSVL